MEQKDVSKLTNEEIEKIRKSLGNVLEIYSKGDPNIKKEGLRILDGWGRIIFVLSNNGKRIGLELTERWERERKTDSGEKLIHP